MRWTSGQDDLTFSLANTYPQAFGVQAGLVQFIAINSSSQQSNSNHTPSGTPLSPSLVTGLGGFKFNLVWDTTVTSSTFEASIISAAQILANALANSVTINVQISDTGTGGGASAGPSNGQYESYASVYSLLQRYKTVGDVSFNDLVNASSVQGQRSVLVWNAQLKIWGLLPSTSTGIDGSATFATDISQNALLGVALHELTHALGRVPNGSAPDAFDLFRFTAPGKLLFSGSIPSSQAYFSIDGGITKLAYFGVSSDPSDFLNGSPSGASRAVYDTTNDAFSEYYNPGSTDQYLTAADLHLLDAIGFTLASLSTQSANYFNVTRPTTPVNIIDAGALIVANLDALNTQINQIYSIAQSDPVNAISISAIQSVNDQSILMLLSDYESLKLNINGDGLGDTIDAVAGTDFINGHGGLNSIVINYHITSDTIFDNAPVSPSNLDKVTGFMSTDYLELANSSTSLNGLTNLLTGITVGDNISLSLGIQVVTAGSAFTVSNSGSPIEMIDIGGSKTFSSVSALIADLSNSARGHTYATFGNAIASGLHFLVEYMGTDNGLHIAEITQGGVSPSTHLAANSTGVDLVDLIGVSAHLSSSHLLISSA